MGGELVRAVDLGGERRDLFLREAADHVAQAVDLLAMAEIKRVQVHRLSSLRPTSRIVMAR